MISTRILHISRLNFRLPNRTWILGCSVIRWEIVGHFGRDFVQIGSDGPKLYIYSGS